MFNADFYPTPTHVIETMLGDAELSGKHVLEPSAGKGNIVDYLKQRGANVMACELNEDLAIITASKCRLLKNDFLEVTREEISHVNIIVMNPPFSADEKHITHAWNIAPDGCEIIALCNQATIENVYSWERRVFRNLIKDYGTSVNIGNVFSDAERKTAVEVALIRLYKPGTSSDFGDCFDYTPDEYEAQYNGLMPYNAVRETVNRYVEACRLYDEVAATAVRMNNIAGVFGLDKLTLHIKEGDKKQTIERFRIDLQKQAWWYVFGKMNMQKYTTGKLKEELNKFVETQQKVPFTMRNVYKMMQIIVGTHGDRMTKELVRVFDDLTERYAENRYNLPGWKTNSHYMVNKKFIIEWGTENWVGKVKLRDKAHERLTDLTKALCFVTGDKYEAMNVPDQWGDIHTKNEKGEPMVQRIAYQWGEWQQFGFFDIKLYKKGTVHARFRDPKVWELFNRAVAKAKGYPLPENVDIC